MSMEIGSNRLDHIVKFANEGIWTLDADDLTEFINERGAAILGYRPEEMLGRPATDFTAPEAGSGTLRPRDAGTGGEERFEHRMRRKDGSIIWTLGSVAPLHDGQGNRDGAVVVFSDISGRKMAEEALRKSEERFRALAASCKDTVYRMSADWSEIAQVDGRSVLEEGENLLGWLVRRVRPEEIPQLLAGIEEAMRSKVPYETERRLRNDDGTERWVIARTVPVFDPDGNVVEWLGMARDITERKKAEEGLKRSRQRFELLSEANSMLLMNREPERAIQTIAGKVLRHLDCDLFFNYIFDEQREKLHLNAFYGISAHAAKEVEWLELGASICGCAARDGRCIVSEDIQHNDDSNASLVRSLGIQAMACHPIMVGDRTVGTLSFGTRDRVRFEADELSLMRIVAEQVSVSIKRRRAEVAVRDREEHLVRAQRIAHIGSFSWDIRRDVFYLSDEAQRIAGLKQSGDKHRYSDIIALTHPDDLPRVEKAVTDGLLSGIYDIDYRIVREGGEVRHVQCQAVVTFDGEGHPMKMVGAVHDITDRHKAEEALRESETKHRQLIEYAPTGIYEIDFRVPKLTAVNDAMCAMSGYSRDELLSMNPFDLLDDESKKLFRTRIAKTLAGEGIGEQVDYTVIKKDGSLISVVLNSKFIIEAGRPIGAFVIGYDVTERRRAEEVLRESEEHLALAQNIAHLGSWVWDLERDRFYASDEAYSIFGIQPGEHPLSYNEFLSLVHPEDRERVFQKAQLTADQEAGEIDYRIINKDGEVRHVHSRGVVAHRKDGRPVKVTGIVQDITERVKMEISLKESHQRYQALIETNVDFIWEMDAQGRYTYCSPQMEILWGFRPEEMIGRTPFDLMPPEMKVQMLERFRSAAASSSGIIGVETTSVDAHGNLIRVETSGVPFFDDKGALLGFRGITRDITDRSL